MGLDGGVRHRHRTWAALTAVVALALVGPAACKEPVNVTVCVVAPFAVDPYRGAQVVVAALEAFEHFNSGNCSLAGDCEDGSVPMRSVNIIPVLVESPSLSPATGVISAAGCIQSGAAVIVGDASSDSTVSIATLAAAFDLPTVSYGAPSATISASKDFPFLLRTSYSFVLHAKMIREMMSAFGWMDPDISIGALCSVEAKSLVDRLDKEFEQIRAVGGAAPQLAQGEFHFSTAQNALVPGVFASSIAHLAEQRARVILLLVRPNEVVDTALALEAAGMLGPEYTYIALRTFDLTSALTLRTTIPVGDPNWRSVAEQQSALGRLLQGTIFVGDGMGEEAEAAMSGLLDEWSTERLVGFIRDQEESGRVADAARLSDGSLERLAESVGPSAFGAGRGTPHPAMGYAYDAAWAAASTLSVLAARDTAPPSTDSDPGGGKNKPPAKAMAGRADEIVEVAREESFRWQSVTGEVAFDGRGDREQASAILRAVSCQQLDERGCSGTAEVAEWTPGLELSLPRDASAAWAWRDGSEFPGSVPPGSFPEDEGSGGGGRVVFVAVACLAAAMVMVAAALLMILRARRMQASVDKTLQYRKNVDLDSPITKVLKTLEDISKGVHVPKHEADGLRLSILSAPNLLAPDASQLAGFAAGAPAFSDVSKFLLYNTICPDDDIARKAYFRDLTHSVAGLPVDPSLSVKNLSFVGRSRKNSTAVEGDDSNGGQGGRYVVSAASLAPAFSGESPEDVTADSVARLLGGGQSATSPEPSGGVEREGLNPFEVDLWEVNTVTAGEPLYFVAMHVIKRAGLIKKLRLDQEKLRNFLEKCESGYYEENPYHNSTHAADVVARLAAILDAVRAKERGLPPVQHLAALLAAVVHDFLHPGTSNAYHVATGNALAVHYNDQHVLENHSLTTTLMMLEQPDMDFLGPMSPGDRKTVRKTMIAMVLCTDLAMHFDALTEFSTKFPGGGGGGGGGEGAVDFGRKPELVLPFLKMAVKAADLGHTALPVPLHVGWVQRLEDEFFVQGDNERREGLPVSPLMDRERPGPCSGENQVGFFRVIVMGLYERLAAAFPDTEPLRAAAAANLEFWAESMAQPLLSPQDGATSPRNSTGSRGSQGSPAVLSAMPSIAGSGGGAESTDGHASGTRSNALLDRVARSLALSATSLRRISSDKTDGSKGSSRFVPRSHLEYLERLRMAHEGENGGGASPVSSEPGRHAGYRERQPRAESAASPNATPTRRAGGRALPLGRGSPASGHGVRDGAGGDAPAEWTPAHGSPLRPACNHLMPGMFDGPNDRGEPREGTGGGAHGGGGSPPRDGGRADAELEGAAADRRRIDDAFRMAKVAMDRARNVSIDFDPEHGSTTNSPDHRFPAPLVKSTSMAAQLGREPPPSGRRNKHHAGPSSMPYSGHGRRGGGFTPDSRFSDLSPASLPEHERRTSRSSV